MHIKTNDPILEFSETPELTVKASKVFEIDLDWDVPAFTDKNDYVPDIDENYAFDLATTKAILAGFCHNKRVLVQGYHGTGKSTHIEQIAARLNWPCVRINLDSHISRIDLLGKDAIILEDGQQVTAFKEGFLPWALQHPVALVFDEYDAGRPDVMFVIQRVLESEGRLTLLEQNRILRAHPYFRLFATSNTVGLGDTSGMYHGTQAINQGQMDRWNIVATLNYLPFDQEMKIVLGKNPDMASKEQKEVLGAMIKMAEMTRNGFIAGDISTLMSPRTVLSWIDNMRIYNGDIHDAFRVTFLNKCDDVEKPIFAEYYQRCFDMDILAI